MSKASLLRTVLAVGFAAGTTLAFASGCSKQGEGERCIPANGSDDCDDGLVCKSSADGDFGRCCPPEGAVVGDARCNNVTSGNTGGTTGNSGGANSGGSSSGGASNRGGSGGLSSTGGSSTDAGGGGVSGEEPATGGATSEASGGDANVSGGMSSD